MNAGRVLGGRVLVTGATGFVGRALVRDLVRRGLPVTATARVDLASDEAVRRVRVADLCAATAWAGALESCETVVHCAARVHVMHDSASNPLAAFRIANADGSARLLEQAIAAGVRRFVYVSSIKVNGESSPPGRPLTEADAPAPVDPYGISKAEAEVRLRAIAVASRLELVIVRPPLVYGPGVKANFLSMTRWLQQGRPLPFGRVTQNRRSLVALDNLLDLLATCLSHPAAAGETFFAADGDDLSTTELLRRTAAALGRPARLIPVPAMMLEIGARLIGRGDLWDRLGGNLQCSIAHATARLGWRPPLSVDEGLRRAVVDLRHDAALP